MGPSRESSSAIFSLMMGEHRKAHTTHADLSTVLRLNDPSRSENKRHDGSPDSVDPVIDHLMGSRALKIVVRIFLGAVLFLGLAIISISAVDGSEVRTVFLQNGGGPGLAACVPFMMVIAMVCSRRLR